MAKSNASSIAKQTMEKELQMEDLVDSTSETIEETEETVTEQDPLKQELDKVQKKEPRTEAEKAAFTLKSTANRLRELGGDPASILGLNIQKEEVENDDDAPVTVGMLKKLQQEGAVQSSLQLADEISNETERELVKYHIENTIRSTGNPNEDLKNARAIVNSVKNSQIAEESERRTKGKTHSSSTSAEAIREETLVLTPEEQQFKRFAGLTDEDILNARKLRK